MKLLDDGKVQYISNRVVGTEETEEESGENAVGSASLKTEPAPWYTPRLTDEEWESYYGGISAEWRD